MRKTLIFSFAILIGILNAQTDSPVEIKYGNLETGQFLTIGNAQIYYETYGKKDNPPLVLIHGNGGSIVTMMHQINHFMKENFVIVADNRTHGKSTGKDELTYNKIAEDYIAIINELSLDSVSVLGQSDGGIVGLLMAINYPQKIVKLVSAVPNLEPGSNAIVEWELEFSASYRALIDSMIIVGDNSRDWEIEKLHMNLMVTEPNIPVTDLQKISCPVLVMSSDNDIIKPRHILEIYENIPNAHLFVMPGATHFMLRDEYELFNYFADRFLSTQFTRPKSKEVLMQIIGIE